MFSIFGQYSTKGLIELNVALVRYARVICSSLIRLRTFAKMEVCTVESNDEIIQSLPWFCLCLIDSFNYSQFIIGVIGVQKTS